MPLGATSTPRITLATESLVLARQVAAPSVITRSLAALANALAERDPDQRHALLHETIERGASRGVESADEVTQSVLVAARLQDWTIALDLATACHPPAALGGRPPPDLRRAQRRRPRHRRPGSRIRRGDPGRGPSTRPYPTPPNISTPRGRPQPRANRLRP